MCIQCDNVDLVHVHRKVVNFRHMYLANFTFLYATACSDKYPRKEIMNEVT